jgi:diguanylate cyclase (GGDEF)-like protein/PAS domain S-box-containing protein
MPLARFRAPAVRFVGTVGARPLRVLFLHQDAAAVERCLRELSAVQVAAVADVVGTPEQLPGRLGSEVYDLVLAEYPGCLGLAAQARQQLQELKHTPLIFLADRIGREAAAELVSNGATDCVDTEHLSHLPVAIRRALNGRTLATERNRAEHQLRHSEAHQHDLVGNLTYGVCACDLEGRFLDADRAMVAMLGYASKDELLAASRAGRISCDPVTRERLRGYVTGAHADSVETEWQCKDGTPLKIRLTGRRATWSEHASQAYELIAEDITGQCESEDHRRHDADTDPLTGLANYRELAQVLDAEIKRSSRTGREFAVLVFDVDRLKRINDKYGHEIGGQALCRVADCLSIFSRQIDTAARLGGDEFALVLPETGEASAQLVADRILERLAQDRRVPRISVSAGVAVYPHDGGRIDALLSVADDAMAAMKGRHHHATPAGATTPA